MLLLLGVIILRPTAPKAPPVAGPVAQEAPATPRFSKIDLTSLPVGGTVPEWSVDQGSFRLVEGERGTALEIGFEPLAEGRMTWARLLGRDGVVRAKMHGERTRRNAPRFALGLAASFNYWFRVNPLQRTVQFVGKEEKVLASVPWEGAPERPLWLELKFTATDEGEGSQLEGRVWYDGDPRPAEPVLTIQVPEQFGFGRAVVAGAPYALKPIYLEALEVGLE